MKNLSERSFFFVPGFPFSDWTHQQSAFLCELLPVTPSSIKRMKNSTSDPTAREKIADFLGSTALNCICTLQTSITYAGLFFAKFLHARYR